MSYDIEWKCRVEDTDLWVEAYDPDCNITWNVGQIIRLSTGLEWNNEDDNGLVKDVVPKIVNGLAELIAHPEKYKSLEAKNGWGTVESVKRFFTRLITEWNNFCEDSWTAPFIDYVHFWIC